MRLACLDHGFVAPSPEAVTPSCPRCLERLYDVDVPEDRSSVHAYVNGLAAFTREQRDLVAALGGSSEPVQRSFFTGAPFLFAAAFLIASVFTTNEAMIRRLGLVPADLRAGRHLETLLTHTFVHASVGHVLGNAVFLILFGRRVGLRLGGAWPLVVIVVSAVSGGLLHGFFTGAPLKVTVGASGVVYGIIGAGLALYPRYRLLLVDRSGAIVVRSHWPRTVLMLAIYIALDLLFGGNVAVLGHLGGLGGGFAAGLLLRRVPPTAQWRADQARDAKAVAEREALPAQA